MLPPRTANGVRKPRRASAAPACVGAPATRRWWWKGYADCSRSVAGGGGSAAQRHRMGRQVTAAAVAADGCAFVGRAAAAAPHTGALTVTMMGRGVKRGGRGHSPRQCHPDAPPSAVAQPERISPMAAARQRGCGKLMPSPCRGRRTIASNLKKMVAGIVILKGYGVTASPPSYSSSPCIPPRRVSAFLLLVSAGAQNGPRQAATTGTGGQ